MDNQSLPPQKQGSTMKKIFLFGCLPLIVIGILFGVILTTCTVGAVNAVDEVVKAVEKENQAKEQALQSQINALVTAQESDILPTGELNDIYMMGSSYTDLQRDKKEKEIKGKIVKWTLKVYEVDTTLDKKGYKIQTSAPDQVGTFIYIHTPTQEDIQTIEALKTGDTITVKGYIDEVSMRNIKLHPAIFAK